MSLLKLFCDVDDFWKQLEAQGQQRLAAQEGHRRREPGLCASEIMTTLIHFHRTGYRCFKSYYEQHVLKHLRGEFPSAVRYSLFVSLMPRVVIALWAYALKPSLHFTQHQASAVSLC